MSADVNPVSLVVMANRLDSITREMTNTVIRTARSTTMAARDFSCSITSGKHELVSCPDGIPVHVFGSTAICQAMGELHPDMKPGDAFIHNDPYMGNSHAADQTILVPVFVEGEHVFTACAKAHQADIGNSLPTTYMPTARDVYAEGALIFPCVRIQEHYADVGDIIRMCARRIRGFDNWYGDYLATLGACRLAERRLQEFCQKFGLAEAKAFVAEWLNYCERMAADAISRLPSGTITAQTLLDPFPELPDGLPLQATLHVDAEAGLVDVDLTENPDCTPTGLNLTESTSRNSAVTAVLTVLNSRRDARRVLVPNNEGTFRRIRVRLRENCVVGIPRHPASCSVATNTVADRVVAMIVSAFAELGGDVGSAEPCFGSPPFDAVVSGHDRRRDAYYILQLFSGTAGGPATSESDGWLAFINSAGAGLGYIDSSEVIEQKYPLVVWEKVVRVDSEGAGSTRGAPGNVSIYGPRFDELRAHYMLDGVVNPPKGVQGGMGASGPEAWLVTPSGPQRLEGSVGACVIQPGQSVVSLSAGGGGYGPPRERDANRVLEDVLDAYISPARAEAVYGVALSGDPGLWETLEVDVERTRELRERASAASPVEVRADPGQETWWIGPPT
jgi:N-methylhydantoinase B